MSPGETPARRRPAQSRRPARAQRQAPDDALQLILIPSDPGQGSAKLLATYGSARVLESFETKGRRWGDIIRVNERIRRFIAGEPNARDLPRDKELVRYGVLLFETLFPGEVRRLYDVARSQRQSRRLDVIFTSMIDWVADKPWEFTFDPTRGAFLAMEEVHFVRNVLTAVPAERVLERKGPLRILVAAAQPVGTPPLSWEDEVRVIRRGFEPLVESGLATVEVFSATTPTLLHRRLGLEAFDVLHFIGHGEYDSERRVGYLVFEDDVGAVQLVDSQTLREIVCGRGLRLVFLNACETGRGGRADFNRGVAPALMAGGLPAVVANQYSVLDPSATAFARHFYWFLAQGRSLGEAAQESRIAVSYSVSGDSIDWAVPVLYARDPAATFCAPAKAVGAAQPDSKARGRRRRPTPGRVRVGLWDVNHVLPSLPDLAKRMTAAQRRFAFEVVEISAPLGTWRLVRQPRSGDTSCRLEAGEVARRLANEPRQLGVEHLLCLTDYELGGGSRDEAFLWVGPEHGPISIFSTAGLLAEIRERGMPESRALANGLVATLASVRGRLAPHATGAKSCPLSQARDVERLTGTMKLDARCRSRLLRCCPEDLDALEKLLDPSV